MSNVENSPLIHPQGYWLSNEEGHYFDPILAQELALLFRDKAVCDFGCGLGKYVRWLRDAGLECDGYDGNPNTNKLTGGACRSLNLAERIQLEKKYDGVISLEVGEHLPKKYEAVFLDNLVRHAGDTIVLSWAIPRQQGDGHVNCRINLYIIYQLWKRGFRFRPRWTALLRANCSQFWFKQTLMVFSRGWIPPCPLPERTAASRILGGDIKRLEENNRSNSPLVDAIVGKLVRTFSPVKTRLKKLSDVIRLFRYDATKIAQRKMHAVASDSKMGDESRFFAVCFTCGKHFKFLRLALLSLGRSAAPVTEISVYMDKSDPLSDRECQLLREESPYPLKFRVTAYPMWSWGPKVQLSELKAYREIASQMEVGDFLVKFDSDVLFVSDRIFRFVAGNKAGAVGTPVSKLHASEGQEEYMQGGCYFIRANELNAIIDMPVAKTSLAPTKWGEHPEDQFFSNLLRKRGVKFLYNDFLYFDPVFIASETSDRDLEKRVQAIPSSASVLHFEGNQWDKVDRTNMRRVADLLFGPLPPISNPYQ
jgi:hypothetical protein